MQIIFAEKCVQADGQFWHVQHFVCSQCSRSLGDQRYVVRDGRPTCVKCFHALLADYCHTCGRLVSVDQRHVTFDRRTWHATPTCFRCVRCRRSLLGKPIIDASDGSLFCSVECSRDRKHVTDDVIARSAVVGKRSRRAVGKNRRKSLGDLDRCEPKSSKRRESVVSLRETSL